MVDDYLLIFSDKLLELIICIVIPDQKAKFFLNYENNIFTTNSSTAANLPVLIIIEFESQSRPKHGCQTNFLMKMKSIYIYTIQPWFIHC